MTTANASCPLDLPATTLTAWRDGALAADGAAHIAAHVSGCPACQQTLALYDSLDEALRRQPVPASDGSLWRAVRASITRADDGSRGMGRIPTVTPRRLLGAGSALAAVLLLALGFAQVFQARGDTIVSRPTATATTVQGTPTPLPTAASPSPAVPGKSLTVTPANLPTSGITFGERSDDILSFGVASTNGNIAYACYSQTSNTNGHVNSQITIYRTDDRAIHWTRLAQFPWPDTQTSQCVVQVDALDSRRVLVNIGGQDVTTFNGVQWYELTEDGGATWTKLSYDDGLSYLATANGRTYAIRQQEVGKQSNGLPIYETHLSVSTDHLRIWQPIDVPITSADGKVIQFWVRTDGAILALVSSAQGMLQQSTDGGAHWKGLPLPTLANGLDFGSIAVQQPSTTSQRWHICIGETHATDHTDAGVVCTADGGQSWTVRPRLCPNAPCSTPGNFFSLEEMTLAADDALLMVGYDNASHLGLYRLPENTNQWEYLGPDSGGFFAPTSSAGGVFWSFAGGIYPDNLSGNIGGHLGTLPNVLLATATYP